MYARVYSAAVKGIDACPVEAEIHIIRGQPFMTIVGLPDTGVKESKDRIRSAFSNGKYEFPHGTVTTINLAPADIKKEGPVYDLPIAVGILACTGQVSEKNLCDYSIVGELALDSSVRPVRGALSMALRAKQDGLKGLIIPAENAPEAAVVKGLDVIPVSSLADAVGFLNGLLPIKPCVADLEGIFNSENIYEMDFSDVKGQENVKRALVISASGGHNMLMVGPPGSGKTMLAKVLPTILPPLTLTEALETTRIHSVAGYMPSKKSLIVTRPYRSPHHTISNVGLVGGGSYPRPGEISLAHNGVLFLDEMPEFDRRTLEVLRQPIEEGKVTIGRAIASLTYPANIMLVAAMNPCPCGFLGEPKKMCICTPKMIQHYMSRISGPLMDRIDIHIQVPAVPYKDLSSKTYSEDSKTLREQVTRARCIQQERFKNDGIMTNARMNGRQVKKYCILEPEAEGLIRNAMENLGLSVRAYVRLLKIGRTIADLDGNTVKIRPQHISEAIQYRGLDRADKSLSF
ncbi:MAG: YifB family Mg chelatase-like AAA ATPase [Planctomycetes bacterium]|nr:YifB family Mg chelatase-like AAA ATPase [Planctomycetota bacterium]